jgi:hypothetical protein
MTETRSAWPDFGSASETGPSTASRNGKAEEAPLPRTAPDFPDPEALKLDAETKKDITETIDHLYRETIEGRDKWNTRHLDYDLMFRTALDIRGDDAGPWENSSNLHVPAPYWLVDSYSTRLTSGVFSTVPQVVGHPTEDDDDEVARDVANLVKWHIEPKRMNARAAWSRMSKTRCIHGRGVGYMPWAKDEYVRRLAPEDAYERDENGEIVVDEKGAPIEREDVEATYERETNYDGPVLIPMEWDQVIEPMEGINLQPITPRNPLGAEWVALSNWETLSLIWKKRKSAYTFIEDDDELSDRKGWIDAAPSQDRSASQPTAQSRSRLQDQVEGRNRRDSQAQRSPRTKSNPEFEVLTWFMPWEIENEKGDLEEAECVFFYRIEPKALIGAFRLSDLQWRNRRPLVELDFQTVGSRRLSMGIMELCADLSAELDTIHNMRIDVGFATNLPFFFFNSTSTITPEDFTLRPGKGIPIDDVRNISFPQMQSVTSFYHEEEQLLFSIIERVFGVTDLFLGVSPTRGAAARHATGFVGTQQEAMARTEEVQSSDATAFSFMCHLIYEAEIQFGPDERLVRLQGREGPLTQRLTRDQLAFRGEYDFSLGANYGLYSSMVRQQQAQILMQMGPQSPFINQDPGRRWEMENWIFHAYGFPEPELFIGPKAAVSPGTATDADEENGEMDQQIYGEGRPAPVHPSDNDPEHIQKHREHVESVGYIGLGSPNLSGHMAHLSLHEEQIQSKNQMQQQAAMSGMQQGPQGQPGQPNPQPNARNVASLEGVESAGAMGDITQQVGGPTGGAAPAPPPGIGAG